MEKRDNVFHYLGQILTIFGVSVVCLSVFSYFVGEDARGYSSIFALGSTGLTLSTLAQFFVMSVFITTLRFILFTDGLISRISLTVRTMLMFFLVVLLIAVFAGVFGWFPVTELKAWGMFFACFAVCAFVSAYIMAYKTDRENKKLEEALKKLQEEEERD